MILDPFFLLRNSYLTENNGIINVYFEKCKDNNNSLFVFVRNK